MNRKRIVAYIAILVAIFLSTSASHASNFRDIERHRLMNGLTVILDEDHSSPVAAIQMWVKVGSADETDDQAGIAHVFEHMLFKGTEKRSVGEIASEIEASGGKINAYTSYDYTVYHIAIASRYLDKGVDIISDAIQNSAFDPDELAKELEVVKEEIRMGEDNPRRKLYKTLLTTAYKDHPYGRPVIGSNETVESFTREVIVDFFKRWYVPNNMTLVISGDINRTEALRLIKNSFRGFKRGRPVRPERKKEPPQNEARATVIAREISQSRMGLSFHIPELKHKDTYALDILALILGQGKSSRLYKELKVKDELVDAISSSAMTPKDPGLFFIMSTLKTENAEMSLTRTAAEVERLAAEGPSLEELNKAKFVLESEFIYERETMQGKAGQLGFYETAYGDLSFEERYLEGIKGVTSEDIKRVLNEYIRPGNMTIALMVPAEKEEELTEEVLIEAYERGTGTEDLATGDLELGPDGTTRVILDNGITLILKEEHANPTVAFYSTFPGGVRLENDSTNGISTFTASMLSRGTGKRTREELANEVETMAGSIGGFSGRNTIGASAKFLSRHFDKGLEIFADLLLNPAFPSEEIEKLKRDTLSAIKREEDNLPRYTFKLLYRTLYETHPYGMSLNGTEDSVASFTRDDIVSFYNNYFVPERMVLVIVGDFDSKDAYKSIKTLLGKMESGSKPLKSPMEERQPEKIRSVSERKETAQTNIGIGFLGTTISNDNRHALSIMAEILSSQGGRLFIKLRDRQSLAYSVSAFSSPGVEPGIFGLYIGTSPEKKDRAIEGILSELKKLREDGVGADELRRAKGALIGAYEIGLQDVSNKAADMAINELLGLGFDYYKDYPERIEAVTSEDVLRAARKHIRPDAYTISIVGPSQ